MLDPKPQWQSETILGVALTLISLIAAAGGYTLTEADTKELSLIAGGIVAGIGALVSWHGRIRATRPVKPLWGSQGPKTLAMITLLPIVLLLTACPANMPERPEGIPEQIEAAEITAQELGASITRLTCTQFEAQRCIEPGKPLDPTDAMSYHARVQEIRGTLRTAALIGAGGVGECLGEDRTQAACLAAAQKLIAELDRQIIEAQRRITP